MQVFNKGVLSKFLFLLVFCAGYSAARSQTIGSWNFNNTLAGVAAANTTVSAASLSPSIPSGAYNGGTVYFGEGGWPAGAINTNMYIAFTITPNAGYTLNLTSVELNIRRSTTGSPSGAGPRQWSLRSSLDGFTSDLGNGAITLNTTPTITVTLGSAFQNLMTPVTFRLYGYDVYNNPGGLNRFVFDNIAVKGLMILPIHFTALSGKRTADNNTLLAWVVDENSNANYFEVERSGDGVNFSTIDRVYKKAFTSYDYTDGKATAGSFVWYRIKAVENNGAVSYSDMLKIQVQNNSGLTISKMYTTGSLINVQINAPANGTAKIMLITPDGKIIMQQTRNILKGPQTIQLNRSGVPGVQVITIIQNDQLISRPFVN